MSNVSSLLTVCPRGTVIFKLRCSRVRSIHPQQVDTLRLAGHGNQELEDSLQTQAIAGIDKDTFNDEFSRRLAELLNDILKKINYTYPSRP